MMATLAGFEGRSFSIGRVFSRAFQTIGANPLAVFGVALLLGAVPGTAFSLATQSMIATPQTFSPAAWAVTSVSLLASVVFAMITQGALVRIVAAHSDGGRATIVDALRAGLRAALPLFLLGLLMGLGIALGLALLIVPGAMLFIMWSVAAPALVEERRSVFGALARSRALTKGARWGIFAPELVVLVFYWLISAVVGIGIVMTLGASGLADGGGIGVGATIVAGVLRMITSALWGTIQTALYIELRDWKDGPAADRLADIFA